MQDSDSMRRRSGADAVHGKTAGPDREVARPFLVPWAGLCVVLLAWIAGSGCSLLRWYAIDQLANAVAHSDTTWSSEEDPDLVKAAAPFSLKLMESVLAETPQHQGLLSAAASGFTQYAFAFVQQDADELEARDLAAAEALRTRAKRLYLRARNYGLRGLAVNHPGFPNALLANPRAAVRATTTADVPFLYWTAAGWAGAISLSVDNPELIAQIPAMEALMDRALELNDSYNRGAIHTFLITYEMSRQGAAGDPAARARAHFERAMALAEGTSAAPLVALAEAVAVRQQDLKGFESLLNRALALNPDAHPDTRLLNLVMQRRARWLLSRKADLFLIEEE
jgi:predicted anti-sigma-YlaC factor YlaD